MAEFPMFAIAKDCEEDPHFGVVRYSHFHVRELKAGGFALMLFETMDALNEYLSHTPYQGSGGQPMEIASKMDLEVVLADARQAGATYVSWWHGPHSAHQCDITELLVALDRGEQL